MYVGDGEFLARIELPDQFTSELDRLALHPALMDIATAFVGLHRAEEFRIPLSYRRIRMFAPLEASLYSHHSFRDADRPGRETVTCDVTVTDTQGNVMLHAEEFVLKKVHDLDERLAGAAGAAAGHVESYDHPVAGLGSGSPGTVASDFVRSAVDHGIDAGQGVDALERILRWAVGPQVLVHTRDLDRVLADIAGSRRPEAARPQGSTGCAVPSEEAHSRPDLSVPYVAPRDALEERLAELWRGLLGLKDLGVHDPFFELGGHSLLGLQLVARLRTDFSVDLPVGAIFNASTVSELAALLRHAGTADPSR
jgi:hypothetical protein